MKEELKILKEISELWPDKTNNGLSIIKKYGYEKVKSVIWYYRNEGFIGTSLSLGPDGILRGKMTKFGYESVPYFPLTEKGINAIRPWYKKLWKLTCESCGKYWIPIILGSATYNMLYDYLPIIISWIL